MYLILQQNILLKGRDEYAPQTEFPPISHDHVPTGLNI